MALNKYGALKYSPLILKLLVTFTKRLSFKTTFKGHSIIMYLNHASTKDVINTQNQCQVWVYFKTTCCVQLKIVLWDIKTTYPKITAAMEKLLYFWVDKFHKRATNSTGIRAKWINCLLYILKVLLNLHNFPLLNINCNEPYLGSLYRSCNIPERVLLNGAIGKRFSKVSRRWRCAACHPLHVFTYLESGS